MKIAIIGQGYVGQTLAVGAATSGFEILGIDINPKLIQQLMVGQSFVPGISRNLLISLIEKKKYTPTSNVELMSNCEIIVIAVPTPIDKNRNPDLSLLKDACKSIQKYASTNVLIISESTSYPGTLRNLIKPTVELGNSNKFEFAVAPERVDPGNFKWNLKNTARVVSGLTDEATDGTIAFYSKFCENIYRAYFLRWQKLQNY